MCTGFYSKKKKKALLQSVIVIIEFFQGLPVEMQAWGFFFDEVIVQ